MPGFKEDEEKFRLLIRKIDLEILKFQKLKSTLLDKQQNVSTAVRGTGFEAIPVRMVPHSDSASDLLSEIDNHMMSLNKLKNFINMKLDSLMEEEELLDELKKKFGNNVEIKKLDRGEFEINFTDSDTKKAYEEIKKSAKLVEEIKNTIHSSE